MIEFHFKQMFTAVLGLDEFLFKYKGIVVDASFSATNLLFGETFSADEENIRITAHFSVPHVLDFCITAKS